MPTAKGTRFIQFCRTAADGITGIIAAAGDNEARAALADRYGRLWSRLHDGTAPISAVNPLPVTAMGPSAAVTWDSQEANSAVVNAASSNLIHVYGTNKGPTRLYFMLFNAVALPANGTVPFVAHIPIPANDGTFSLDISGEAKTFGTGLTWGISTTPSTLTAYVGAVVTFIDTGYV
jgi:hypothetical protein